MVGTFGEGFGGRGTIVDRRIRQFLSSSESIIMCLRQGRISSITPSTVIATESRILIVDNSFWGFYTGYNILSPTEVTIIPYKNVTSVVLLHGRRFSTVRIRIMGASDTGSEIWKRDGYAITGLEKDDAMALAEMMESIIDTPGVEAVVNKVGVSEIPKMIINQGRKIIWLGTDHAARIANMLNVHSDHILHVAVQDLLEDKNIHRITRLEHSVLVSYSSFVAAHVAHILKKKYGLNFYVMEGGLLNIRPYETSDTTHYTGSLIRDHLERAHTYI